MKAFIASLINATFLIALGLWAYFGSDDPSLTALIPVFIGAILLILNRAVKRENKVIAHFVVVITLLTLFALIKPLTGALGRSDNLSIMRVVLMMASTLLALGYFVKSFIDARKNPAN